MYVYIKIWLNLLLFIKLIKMKYIHVATSYMEFRISGSHAFVIHLFLCQMLNYIPLTTFIIFMKIKTYI